MTGNVQLGRPASSEEIQAWRTEAGGTGLLSSRCLFCVPGRPEDQRGLSRGPRGRLPLERGLLLGAVWPPSLPRGGSEAPLLKTPDSGPLEPIPRAAQLSLCVMPLKRGSPERQWFVTRVFMHCYLSAPPSLLSSPPPPSLASEHHLSLQPASATPACLLPGKPPPWQPAGFHMTCTRAGREGSCLSPRLWWL